MSMARRIGRTLPPAAAPLHVMDIVAGGVGLFRGSEAVKNFENELEEYYSVRNCYAVSSGKAALFLILQALRELSPGRDEVLIPAYTCYSVPSAIVRAGLKVQLCDLAEGSVDFDFDSLKGHLENPRLLCVISTHLFGLPADVERIKTLIKHRDIFIVEDAAQAMGGEWNSKKMGTLGDVGLFSMGRGKAFSTVEGGIILTDNELIGRAIKKRLDSIGGYTLSDYLKLFLYAVALAILINPRIYWLPKMLPFLKLGETRFDSSFPIMKLSPFQAGLTRGWRRRIADLKSARQQNAKKYVMHGMPMPCAISAIPDMIRFPVLMADADAKRSILRDSENAGLGIADGYPDSINNIKELQALFKGKEYPAAKDVAERIVSLPLHPFVTDDDIKNISSVLRMKNLYVR